MKLAVIGYGEAGPVFAEAFRRAGWQVTAHDIDPTRTAPMQAAGVTPAASHQEAVAGAALILSTVTARNAVAAAASVETLTPEQTWLDLNSVGPQTKAAIADEIARAGGCFVEGVAMDTVPLRGAQVPLLLCGARAKAVAARIGEAGLNARVLGTEPGLASATKLTRSILMKGLEALFAEAAETGDAFGVTDEVLASMNATFPGLDWPQVAGYHLRRMAEHGTRRAAEMREAAAMVEAAGTGGALTRAIAERHEGIGALGLDYEGEAVADFLAALAQRRGQGRSM